MTAGGRPAGLKRRPLLRTLPLLAPVLGMTLAGVLTGCGWHAPYAPAADGGPSAARTGLGLVSVPVLGERAGQLLHQALQARLDHGDAPVSKKYDLMVDFGVDGDALSVQRDDTSTRVRYIAHVAWKLVTRDARRATVTSGYVRTVDGLNTFDEQYFAQDLETEAVFRRMTDALAEQIVASLAVWFDKHPA